MGEDTISLVLWRSEHELLTLEDLAYAAGLHPELVAMFVSYGLIEPEGEAGCGNLFAASSVRRLRSIVRLRDDLGVNLAGIAVILEMRDRIEALQRELRHLRMRIEQGG
jgi:DNA-binding transcriptional MerR regulator